MPIPSYAPYGTNCCMREAICETEKSVSDGLWSWYGSLSNAFQQLLRKLFKTVNASGLHTFFVCVFLALGTLRKSQVQV